MADVTLIGGGEAVRSAGDILARAGFSLHHTFELEQRDHSPVILGEIPGAFSAARQVIQTGRHLMIAAPQLLPIERLPLLLENRKRAQCLFVWSDRRFHPGYRFVRGLIEADATWRPRFIRQEVLTTQAASSTLLRWRILECAALLLSLTKDPPRSLSASSAPSSFRSSTDYLQVAIKGSQVDAFLGLGLGDVMERREVVIGAGDRKAFIDELNRQVPVRLIDEEPGQLGSGPARWVSCPPPSQGELARRLCLAFLEATVDTSLAQDEATLWAQSVSVQQAIEHSLQEGGATIEVQEASGQPRFRLLTSRPVQQVRPMPA